MTKVMGMLIVTRKTNESITIEPLGNVDPDMTLGEAFQNGPIEIKLVRINRSRVRLAIAAPPEFQVWRGKHVELELSTRSPASEPADAPAELDVVGEL
jgi:sRNA-binding carbon storage regulator CsrA